MSLVSVIVPAYNAAPFIRPALQSVLTQTYEDLEVLVVDDGSQDETAAIVASLADYDERIRLLAQPNRGVAAARNLAIAHSNGTYIAPLDADDVWHPEKIERQVERMQRGGPDLGLVYTWSVHLNEAGVFVERSSRIRLEGEVYEALFFRNFLSNGSVPLMRRVCLEEVGGYDTQLRAQGGEGCEDWDLSLRIAERYAFGVAPAYLVGYRQVAGSMSQNYTSMARSRRLVIEGAARQHPELPRSIVHRARSRLYFYQVLASHHAGNLRGILRWAYKCIRADPMRVLSPGLTKLAMQTLLHCAKRALTPDEREDPEDRTPRDRHLTFSLRESFPPAELEDKENEWGAESPWCWWKPYDRICQWRWQRLIAEGDQHIRPDGPATPLGEGEAELTVP